MLIALPDKKIVGARVRETGAYEGETNSSPDEAKWGHGNLFVYSKYGKNLLGITTGEQNQFSCVILRGIDVMVDDAVKKIMGPGVVSEKLGISKGRYDGLKINDLSKGRGRGVSIHGDSADEDQIKELAGNSENCKGIYRLKIATPKEDLETFLREQKRVKRF